MKRYKTKFEEAENQYIYYMYLKEINDIIYDKSKTNKQSDMTWINIREKVRGDSRLTTKQKKYLSFKTEQIGEIYHDLDAGYIFVWSLNNNQRNRSYYHRTLNYIRNLDWEQSWSIRKYNIVKKMFYSIRKDSVLLSHEKENLMERLFYEIKKQAELENHSEKDILYRVDGYEDICDLLDVFFKD